MAIREPFTDLDIRTADSGFYEGYSVPIALISKVIMAALGVLGAGLARQRGERAGERQRHAAECLQHLLHRRRRRVRDLSDRAGRAARDRASPPRPRRREARIHDLLVVLDDVRRGSRRRAHGVRHRRAARAVGLEPAGARRQRRSEHSRGGRIGLSATLSCTTASTPGRSTSSPVSRSPTTPTPATCR